MAGLIRRIRRSSKKAAKYSFSASLQELLIVVDDQKNHPETLAVSFQHRRRKVCSRERKWETSFTRPEQSVVVWPEQTAETIDIRTTLYKGAHEDTYEDKEWTLVVEEVTSKGKRKPLAAVPLNMRLFIHEDPDQRSQLKLKLRPLVPHVTNASMVITLSSRLLNEGFKDDMSQCSSREQSVVDGNDIGVPVDAAAEEEIAHLSNDIQEWGEKKKDRSEEEKENGKEPIKSPSNVRPPWRVPADQQRRPSEDMILKQTAKIPTELFFEVDKSSLPIPVPNPPRSLISSPRTRSSKSITPARDGPPEVVPDEGLLAWCQRVTRDYAGVRVNDFSKSFWNGLALCAIVHAYRPSLIGPFENLDFSENTSGKKQNIEKALEAIRSQGVRDVPNAMSIFSSDQGAIKRLVENIRRILEGNEGSSQTPVGGSDHRLSQLYPISDSEKVTIDEFHQLKKKSAEFAPVNYNGVTKDDAILQVKLITIEPSPSSVPPPLQSPPGVPSRLRSPPSSPPADVSPSHSREAHDPFASSSDEENVKPKENEKKKEEEFETVVTPVFPVTVSGRLSPKKKEEYRKKAREMLENPSAAIQSVRSSEARERARRIIEDANSDGQTFLIQNVPKFSSSLRRTPSSSGSNGDLRRVELVTPNVHIHPFRKRDPSPVMERKIYENGEGNVIPAIGGRSRMDTRQSTEYRQPRDLSSSAMDRVRRFGSMRSQELKETMAAFVRQYGTSEVTDSPSVSNATPTRKVTSQWEKDVKDVERTTREQEMIADELQRVTQLINAKDSAIRNATPGSSEESELVRQRIQFLNQKNLLVGRQEYYNIIENLRDVTANLENITAEVDNITHDNYYKTEEEKERTERLMEKYMEGVQQKEQLTTKLFQTEHELQEEEDRLEEMRLDEGFGRTRDEPISASRRVAQGFKDWLNR